MSLVAMCACQPSGARSSKPRALALVGGSQLRNAAVALRGVQWASSRVTNEAALSSTAAGYASRYASRPVGQEEVVLADFLVKTSYQS
jgi:hypothetical protein